MRTTALALTITCGLCFGAPTLFGQEAVTAAAPAAHKQPAEHKPVVQLAILLDTSGSMDGLIEQAKIQLWSIVNEFATAKQQGQRPELQVALYEYGKQSIPESEGFLRMILPLTTDLDKVSEQLFALRTDGGEEYCGRVIHAATRGLDWSDVPFDLRLIVIAGNEPFTQGDLHFKDAVAAAVKRGCIINTIHCGDRQLGIQTGWEEGAKLGEGTYSVIDQNAAVAHIPSPQDEEIAQLGVELNSTYLAYGEAGLTGATRQELQDVNAASAAPSAPVQRAVSKASALYSNAHWDLVDAVQQKKVKLEDVKESDLPEDMRKMTKAERAQHIEKMAGKRQQLQGRIQALETERQKFIAEKRRAEAGSDTTLGKALIEPMRQQAERKGYEFDKK
jgi:hypothetical protein